MKQLEQASLNEISIVLEYFVSGKLLRLDAVLIGYNYSSQLNVRGVEMKEWESFKAKRGEVEVSLKGTYDITFVN